jgi:uncharacterized membrane protein YfcA
VSDPLVALPFGLAIGLSVGLMGGGGSVLAVPVLVYVLGEDVEEATTVSLAVVAAGALFGALGHARAGRVCWHHAATFTLAAIPGIAVGTLIGEGIGEDVLLAGFAVVMIVAAQAIWRKGGERPDPAQEGAWERGGACPPLRLPRDAFFGAGVGLLTGLFGVGGGFLIVPTLAVALAFTMRTAVGTSLAIITATSVLGLAVHLLAGRGIEADVTLAMSAACAVGAVAGAAWSGRVPQPVLAHAFAVMVAAVAGYVLIAAAA